MFLHQLNGTEKMTELATTPTAPCNHAEVAMYHYYLTNAVLTTSPNEQVIGEVLGMGEDVFVMELFTLSEAFWQKGEDLYAEGKAFSGLAVFDVVAELAEFFWGYVEHTGEMPDLDAFKLDIDRVFETYTR
jgi:hypothetical protein